MEYGQLDKDVRAAVHYLQSQQYRKIVCTGASMGGTACLRVAIDDKPFIGLIVFACTLAVRYKETDSLRPACPLTFHKFQGCICGMFRKGSCFGGR